MMSALVTFWIWLLDGVTEAVLVGLRRFVPKQNYRLKMGLKMAEASLFGETGEVIGKITGEGENFTHFEPPNLAVSLKGTSIDVEIPPAWVLRRLLNPIASQSAPFAEAFARHHIERVTPWRAEDTYFNVTTAPIKDNANELSVTVDVVAKRMVDPALRWLLHAHPERMRLTAQKSDPDETIIIPVETLLPGSAQKIRKGVKIAFIMMALLFVAWFAFVPLRLSHLSAENEDLDRQITTRKNVMLAAMKGQGQGDPLERLRYLRHGQPRVVSTLEALSVALPDNAYLTDLSLEGDKLRITGIATRASELVPALERSKNFSDVTFTAATTREEGSNRDRFHLEMRIVTAGERKQ